MPNFKKILYSYYQECTPHVRNPGGMAQLKSLLQEMIFSASIPSHQYDVWTFCKYSDNALSIYNHSIIPAHHALTNARISLFLFMRCSCNPQLQSTVAIHMTWIALQNLFHYLCPVFSDACCEMVFPVTFLSSCSASMSDSVVPDVDTILLGRDKSLLY